MDLGLTDKVAIVTGGSEGIGKAAAQRMAEEGGRVVIVARNQERLDQAAQDIRTATEGVVLPVSADVSHPDSAERVVQTAPWTTSGGWTSWSTTPASRWPSPSRTLPTTNGSMTST